MLITLKSKPYNDGVSSDESASNWTNYFKEGIRFTPNSTAQLVSCSVNKTDSYIIEEGINDTFVYAIGNTGEDDNGYNGPFSQHQITLEPGGYSGESLAAHIQQLLIDSTLLGIMKYDWECIFTPPVGFQEPLENFEIKWDQGGIGEPYTIAVYDEPQHTSVYPNAPALTWEHFGVDYAKSLQSKVNFNQLGGDDYIGIGPLTTNNIQGFNLDQGSIFCNGGLFSAVVAPVNVIGEYNLGLIRGLQPGDDELTLTNWYGAGTVAAGTVSEVNPALYSGFEYLMQVPTGEIGSIEALAVLPGANGLSSASIGPLGGGSLWIVGDEFTITGSIAGVNATAEVITVDANLNDALTGFFIKNPGINFAVNEVTVYTNPNPLGTDGDGIVVDILPTFSGTNLVHSYTLTTAVTTSPVEPTNAIIQMLTLGPNGAYDTSEFQQRGHNYSVGDIVYIENAAGDNPYFTVTQTVDEDDIWFLHVTEEGAVGMSMWDYPHDPNSPNLAPSSNNAEDSGQWDIGFKLGGDEQFPDVTIDASTRLLQINLFPNEGTPGELYGAVPNIISPDGIIITDFAGVALPVSYSLAIPTTSVGYTRRQNKQTYTNEKADLYVTLTSTEDNTDVNIRITQLQTVGSGSGVMVTLFDDEITNVPELAAFTTGDWLKVDIHVVGIVDTTIIVAHDTQGNNIWTEGIILESGVTPVPNQIVPNRPLYESNIRECMYPLTPILNTCIGTGFSAATIPDPTGSLDEGMATVFLAGHVDSLHSLTTPNIYSPSTLVTGTETDDQLFNSLARSAPGTPVLPYFFKFGNVRSVDTDASPLRIDAVEPRLLWEGLVAPNTGNINRQLAMYRVYNYDNDPASSADILPESQRATQPDVLNPTIQIELPDFNLKSFSGQSSDTGRAIAVIPREQFTTDERSGVLHYESQYPVVIDLNCKDNIVLNHLSVRMRNLNGRLATLQNPTQVTILIKEKDQPAQTVALQEAMERVERKISETQSSNIAIMNSDHISPI